MSRSNKSYLGLEGQGSLLPFRIQLCLGDEEYAGTERLRVPAKMLTMVIHS